MVWNIIGTLVVIAWIFINCVTARFYNIKEMRDSFVHGQCLVGKVFANIFYAPAWLLKGLRLLVLATIK